MTATERMFNNKLIDAINNLACAVRDASSQQGTNAILLRIAHMESKIMSQISNYGDRVSAAFDELGTAVDGVATDVQFLKDEIAKLQNNPGPISPEDQAILDGLESRATSLSAKMKALDEATTNPPTP